MQTPDPQLDKLLRTAIGEARMLQLRYRNRERIVEPHDYGRHKGVIKVLTYQIGGSSSQPLPNWRWVETDTVTDVRILDQTFPGGRPGSSGKHNNWDELFIRVRPAGSVPKS